MAQSLSRLHRAYLQNETTWGQAPNSSGTSTVGNANALAFTRFSLRPDISLLRRPDKTGTRSQRAGRPGRRIGSWEYEGSLVTNGTGGVLPDQDPIWRAAFSSAGVLGSGQVNITSATNASPIVITATAHGLANFAAVFIEGVLGNLAANGPWIVNNVTANTFELMGSTGNGAYTSGGIVYKASVRYSFSDDISSFTAFSYRTPSTLEQQMASGCIVSSLRLVMNQDIATLSASGASKFVASSRHWSSHDADTKSGLTTFPAEPSTPVLNGDFIEGFTGLAVVGSYGYTKLRSASINLNTGNELPRDYFGTFYPVAPEGDQREVTLDFAIDDEDTAAVDQFYTAAMAGTSFTGIFGQGYRRGNCVLAVLQGLQFPAPGLDDSSRRFQRSISGAVAAGSTLSARDELTIWIV